MATTPACPDCANANVLDEASFSVDVQLPACGVLNDSHCRPLSTRRAPPTQLHTPTSPSFLQTRRQSIDSSQTQRRRSVLCPSKPHNFVSASLKALLLCVSHACRPVIEIFSSLAQPSLFHSRATKGHTVYSRVGMEQPLSLRTPPARNPP